MPKKKEDAKIDGNKASNSINKHLQHLVQLEEKMLSNMNNLQKVQVQIAEKFDNLASNLSELLGLFETTAQVFAQDPMHQVTEKDAEFLEKVNQLLDQNKTIAQGLVTMEEKLKGRSYPMLPHYTTPTREIPIPRMARPQPQPITQEKEDREPDAPSGPRPLPKF